jgi:hypothetical protein
MKQLFNDYYNKEKDIKNYNGVEFVAYDKEYTDEQGSYPGGGKRGRLQ